MRKQQFLLLHLLAILSHTALAQEKLLILNEGSWQSDNGRVSYFEDGTIVSNQWFRDVNGYKLGDTPNDIIQVNDTLIAIAVNTSNIVQFINPNGKAVAATENIPNNRKLATDGDYVYVTSYAHECLTPSGTLTFTKGYVAKIDITTFQVVAATEVGYEPEGIAHYDGHLFVANSGGYSYQEAHDYETTVSVLNAKTMELLKTIDTGKPNLYGKMSQSDKYLCINSSGDYYSEPASTIIFDCQKVLQGVENSFVTLPYPATYNTATPQGMFLVLGSSFSYTTGGYEFNYLTIDPEEVMQSNGTTGISQTLPGTMVEDIQKMKTPYGIYVNPYTGYLYATVAGDYVSSGTLHQWSPDGVFLGEYQVYINPAHFLALKPDGNSTGIEQIPTAANSSEGYLYDLQGRRVHTPSRSGIYIRAGKKILAK